MIIVSYVNIPMQYAVIFTAVKMTHFQIKEMQ